jgi:hypothetical protein
MEILAQELGYKAIREDAVEVHNLHKFFRLLDEEKEPFVLQAPGLCSFVHAMPCAVVIVRRKLDDIIRSQHRIRWDKELRELEFYFTDTGPIGSVKYAVWELYQKRKLGDRAYELDYESLRGHPLWVEKEERRNFGPRQTRKL